MSIRRKAKPTVWSNLLESRHSWCAASTQMLFTRRGLAFCLVLRCGTGVMPTNSIVVVFSKTASWMAVACGTDNRRAPSPFQTVGTLRRSKRESADSRKEV